MKTSSALKILLATLLTIPCALQCMGEKSSEKYAVETSRKEEEKPDTIITVRQSPDLESRVSVLSSTVTEPSLTRTAEQSPAEPSRALEAESKESATRATSPSEPSEIMLALFLRADRNCPFHMAASLGGNGSEQLLLQAIRTGECDPNARDNQGRTLLHYAAANGHVKIFNFLLAKRNQRRLINEISPMDNNNRTPLDYANEFHHTAIIEAYLQHDQDRTMLSHEVDVLAEAHGMNRNILLDEFKHASEEMKTTNQPLTQIILTQIPRIPTQVEVLNLQQQEYKEPVAVTINNHQQVNVIVDDQLPQAAHNNFLTNQPQAHRHRSPSSACCCTRWCCLAVCAVLTVATVGITLGISASKGMM